MKLRPMKAPSRMVVKKGCLPALDKRFLQIWRKLVEAVIHRLVQQKLIGEGQHGIPVTRHHAVGPICEAYAQPILRMEKRIRRFRYQK